MSRLSPVAEPTSAPVVVATRPAPAKRGHSGRHRRRGDSGYALILTALLLIPMLAFTGLGVDVGSWYATANRVQRAADAAALAGVIWMPDVSAAEDAALAAARRNGYNDDADDIDVEVVPVGEQRLRVTIHDADVDVFFSSVFLDNVDVTRRATAEYVRSVPMGSPNSVLANDPESWNDPTYERPFYWLTIAGPLANKANGDRHAAGYCGTGSYSGCSGTTNSEFSDAGYYYRLEVLNTQAAPLRIQAFDPALTNVGSFCTTSDLIDPTDSSKINTLVAQGHADAGTRLTRGATRWCPGDGYFVGYSGSSDWRLKTTYIVRGPDDTPFDNTDNPIICGKTFDAYDENTWPLLNQADGYKDGNIGTENMPFDEHFRQWVDICSVPAGSAQIGEYLIQVTTTADLSSPPNSLVVHDSLVNTRGYNKFSMRAGFGTPGTANFSTDLNLFADGRLPITVNQSVGGTPTNFYLAHITPEYAGQILQLEFFDVADGANSDLTIVPPADQTGDPLGACTFIRDDSPPVVISPGNCTITGLNNAQYNGKKVTVSIPIPINYGCAAGSRLGCWFKIHLDFNGATPHDVTTWSAKVVGDPVRLVE